MWKKKAYIILLMIGIGAGILFGLHKARASSPENETSGGEQPASVYYDEFWQATEAVVSSNNGYTSMNPSGHAETVVAAAWTTTNNVSQVSLLPKMVVTQWTVHGHIHFE
ncbi:MAG: hypothetical protein WC335_07795 [Candidatus Omnitrophota bacterium]|jgi:hypothetical protein